MTIGDTAALLIGVSLMKLYKPDEDAATREKRIKREKRLRRLDPTMEGIALEEQRRRQETLCRVRLIVKCELNE